MELLSGQDLGQLMRRAPLAVERGWPYWCSVPRVASGTTNEGSSTATST